MRIEKSAEFEATRDLVRQAGLHTVCESAACPNIGECWSHRTLTFMILGNVCTRSCGFCDVQTGRPGVVDRGEPSRVAKAVAQTRVRYAVITSVDRDDLADGGAAIWAETIRAIRAQAPATEIEVLTPDFKGELDDVTTVTDAGPDVFAHNIETVARLHDVVRPQARYERSLAVLAHARRQGVVTKSGIMLGLGETDDEVIETMRDLHAHGVEIVSIGQYMRPSAKHLPVMRWATPETFERLKLAGEALGLAHVESAPLVRSSYRADQQAAKARQDREQA